MADYAALITFPEQSRTYEAYSKITKLPGGVAGAAIVERDENGAWKVTDASDPSIGTGFVGGSLIGTLVGVLGGPLGMLLGWATGAAVGGAVDADRAGTSVGVLEEFASRIPAGGSGLIVQGTDAGAAGVDKVVEDLGGEISRRPLDEVMDELDAQEEAAEEAAAAARKSLREKRRTERKEKWEDRWEDIKKSFTGKDKPAGA